jgi:undecaprenyl-diphosphatase
MEWMVFLQSIMLGVVEGLTEFLPVSSTGHLIIVGDALGFTGEKAKTFQIFIQLGAIMGVMGYYRHKVTRLLLGLHRAPEQRFVLNLLIAFLPAAIVGVLAHQQIKAYLFSPLSVAAALITGGFAILLIEWWPRRERVTNLDQVTPRDALKIGVAQMVSLVPGISRAGATIMGGLVAGLSRTAATEFSFFLAMPTMLAATLYDLSTNLHLLDAGDAGTFAVGFVTAFLTALGVVKTLLVYVSRHSFMPFAWYRIGFGLLVLWYFG